MVHKRDIRSKASSRERKIQEHLKRVKAGKACPIMMEFFKGKEGGKYKYEFIRIKPGAEVRLTTTGELLPRKIIDDCKLWTVDAYFPKIKVLNINRTLDPYPAAFCSLVREKDVIGVP